ncbi:hypothetical protein J7K93_14340 [bacterium]|nr:hypothetical protein [bacterium]
MDKLEKIKELIRPGDVINTIGKNVWYNPLTYIPNKGIALYQRCLFGRGSDYRDTHTTMYFGDNKVFSTTFPKAKWEDLEERVKMKFTIYRYSGREYADKHISIMYNVAEDLIGREYDVGDLFDFMICGLLGYDSVRKVRFFELSRKNLVCSTSVRTIQEKLRKTLEEEGDFLFKRLFNTLNHDKWSSRKIEKFERTDVEMTTPAHYGNSEWFEGEFVRVCGWQDFE